MLMSKQKKNQNVKQMRLLITINVLGSAGPIRFVVNEEEQVSMVIYTALKNYAREGRLPVLGSDISAFALYCPHHGSDALSPLDTIGAQGARNFMLCKKPQASTNAMDAAGTRSGSETRPIARSESGPATITRRGNGSWKAWFNKSLSLKISSH